MELNEIVRTLHWLIQESEEHRFEYGDSIVMKFKARDEIEEKIKDLDFDFEKIGKNEISVTVSQYNGLFYDREHFLKESMVRSDSLFDSNIGIVLFMDRKPALYDSSTKETYIDFKLNSSNYFILNTFYYWKFFDDINSSKIISYHSVANREFVVISPEKGEFLMGYPPITPQFDDLIHLEGKYKKFQDLDKSQEFRAFFKGQIIEFLTIYEHDQRFPGFITNIESIIEGSNRNYEVFLNKFDFKQLKENFRKERDEYFSTIRDLVNQLLSKIVSIPISISASALAIYNLRDEPTFSFIVVVAFIVYSGFTSFLLRLHHFDTIEIGQDLEKDIAFIRKASNIPSDFLQEETRKVTNKINKLETTIIALQIILMSLSISVSAVFLNFINLPTVWNYLILIAIGILQIAISFLGLYNKNLFGDRSTLE